MQNQYIEIGEILAKYPEISADEERILAQWIEEGQNNRQIFEELTSNEHAVSMIKRVEELRAESKDKWPKLLSVIHAEPDLVIVRRDKRQVLIRLVKYMVAASIVVMSGLWFYVLKVGKEKHPVSVTPVAAKVHDALPGKFKARLTLVDGTVVVLDSANNQTIQQGSIAVKNKEGQLVYESKEKSNTVLYNTLTTGKGETYATLLSDGTKIWLNSQSSVRYPVSFNGSVRKVEITGEAYFEVAPSIGLLANGQKGRLPFIVSLPGMEVEVLGTHFDINSYDNEEVIKTTLLEGKVRVHSAGNGSQTILLPGEQAQMKRQTQALTKTKGVDVDAEVAWRYGYFEFNGVDLHTLMRTLERWYDIQTVYEGDMQQKFLGDIPRNMNLSQVMDILKGQGIKYKIEGKKITVSPEKQ